MMGNDKSWPELTQDQLNYLKERGFEIIQGMPVAEDKFPYVVLGFPRQILGQSEISYNYSPSHYRVTREIRHPSTHKSGLLIREIELMVGRDMELEGKVIRTTPGQPIKVFVLDRAWNLITKELTEKYPSKFLPLSRN